MKILQIFGAVVAVHLLAFIFIFASPGCSSSPRNVPTPDATMPNASAAPATVTYPSAAEVTPTDLSTSGATTYAPPTSAGRATPTRPGSPNAVAVTPAKAVAEVAPVSTYTVQKGDSLWSIAKKNHMPVAELAKANNLSANAALQPGKKLIVPGKAPAPTSSAPVATGAATATTGPVSTPSSETKSAGPTPTREVTRHTVAAGESLGTIARKYGMTVGELAAANNITDPAKIFVGQSLIVAGGKSAGPRPTASSSKSSAKPAATAAGPVATPSTGTGPTAAETAAATPHFEIKAPPPGQDLDAGLKETTTTEVPTVKVEEPKTEEPPKK
ncbi:MAG TPA: LysM peptidoglycan-binding domain-containing protein [Candidatus Didemnitutus sp.]|nr:LysM peptidoglycan-binding domain-containing protein [Candidatus Didemnitutus sp.]